MPWYAPSTLRTVVWRNARSRDQIYLTVSEDADYLATQVVGKTEQPPSSEEAGYLVDGTTQWGREIVP